MMSRELERLLAASNEERMRRDQVLLGEEGIDVLIVAQTMREQMSSEFARQLFYGEPETRTAPHR